MFEIKSGKMRVTDPCYDKDTWCAGVLENVKNGTWVAEIKTSNEGSWGNRVSELIVRHESHLGAEPYERQSIDVGVDSGQAGFFDEAEYHKDGKGEYGDPNTFYGKVCEITLGPDSGGVVPFGAVSSSGYGDGSYVCYTLTKDGEIVAAKIVFIGDEDEEEEE